MDHREWLPLLGLAATDARIVSMLAKFGTNTPITLPHQTSETGVDFKQHGMFISFKSEFALKGGSPKLPILTTVGFKLVPGKKAKGWVPYTGSLPGGIEPTDGKDELIVKLGRPVTLDEFFNSAAWLIETHRLGVLFTEDWKQMSQLGLSMPGAV